MYSFEGDFRRRPQQNLAGASARHTLTRDELLKQAQEERTKREEHRRRLNSTIKIQAFVRSFITRVRCKASERQQFENRVNNSRPINEVDLIYLIRRLLFFYNQPEDFSRLILISQQLLKQWTKVLQSGGSYFQIRRLLALHLKLLNSKKSDGRDRDSLAVPLRMLEVFTCIDTVNNVMPPDVATTTIADTLLYLIKRGYYREIRCLLESRTPSLYGPSPNPPVPLAGSLFELMVRPFPFVETLQSVEYNNVVLREFASSILCPELTEVVKMYVLPALKNGTVLPYAALVWSLRPDEDQEPPIPYTMWLLYCVLYLQPPNFVQSICGTKNTNFFWNPQVINYLQLISKLTENLCLKVLKTPTDESYPFNTQSGYDGDSESEGDEDPISQKETEIHNQCAEMLNSSNSCILYMCSQAGQNDWNEAALEHISGVCHHLLLSNKAAIHYKLTYTLAFKQWFLRSLWSWASNLEVIPSNNSASTSGGLISNNPSAPGGRGGTLLADLSQGIGHRAARLLPPLATFCSLYSLLLATLHDEEFANSDVNNIAEESSTSPTVTQAFSFTELGPLCVLLRQVCTGLIELAFPEQRPNVGQDYKSAVFSSDAQKSKSGHQFHNQTAVWAHLFKVSVRLLRQLHTRDQRLHFTTGEREWCMGNGGGPALPLLADRPHHLLHPRRNHRLRLYRPFAAFSALTREDCEDGPPLTTKEVRTLTILKEIPFVVPFSQRVLIFQGLIMKDKQEHQGDLVSFLQGPSIHVMIRRSHLYEDAFDKLSPQNEPDLRLKMRVQLMNEVGLEEAGVDGGGVFREFLSELLRTACDPNRGFFRLTRDNTLYPNPAVHLLVENFQQHYYFIGRMLGKALYEGLLVELPLAEFFLQALVGEADSGEADIHRLGALDERLHRSLLQLRALPPAAVADLGLDFTVMSDELGEQRVEELKPGGSNIPVTAENRIEYIHLVAEWKLSRQVRLQTAACRQGLNGVVPLAWLRLFGPKELRLLVSGAESAVDVEDLRLHTNYGGGYSLDHPTIKFFWKVVEDFTDIQKRQLLKFVTSCSRPPLLGFKDLDPPFCIQHAGTSERLPSASTCMNLLKLPEFHSETTLKEKLLYAINAGAGFELS